MQQTISVTEARNNFPALVRQVAKQNKPVVVTSRNKPQVVLVRWETYQKQQANSEIAARAQLPPLVATMLQTAQILEEVYEPDSYDHKHDLRYLHSLAQQSWEICSTLDKGRQRLALLIADSLANLLEEDRSITLKQLVTLIAVIPLLNLETMSREQLRSADLSLLNTGLNAAFPSESKIVDQDE